MGLFGVACLALPVWRCLFDVAYSTKGAEISCYKKMKLVLWVSCPWMAEVYYVSVNARKRLPLLETRTSHLILNKAICTCSSQTQMT